MIADVFKDHFTQGLTAVVILALVLIALKNVSKIKELLFIGLAAKAKAAEIDVATKTGRKPPSFGVFTQMGERVNIEEIIPKRHRTRKPKNNAES